MASGREKRFSGLLFFVAKLQNFAIYFPTAEDNFIVYDTNCDNMTWAAIGQRF